METNDQDAKAISKSCHWIPEGLAVRAGITTEIEHSSAKSYVIIIIYLSHFAPLRLFY